MSRPSSSLSGANGGPAAAEEDGQDGPQTQTRGRRNRKAVSGHQGVM